jgi:hypothetical protein
LQWVLIGQAGAALWSVWFYSARLVFSGPVRAAARTQPTTDDFASS